jgi:DNA-binding NtrC family response regulator
VLGRGDAHGDPTEQRRVVFERHRPGARERTPPLAGRAISRDQLRVRVADGELAVERIGRCAMLVSGERAESATVRPGDTIHLRDQIVLVCVARAPEIPPSRHFDDANACAFGAPDALGILGESAAAWELRERVAFAAKADGHVLVLGESGTGKELAARAVHALSRRARAPFVARNAATLPSGLIDAELFGNARNYPNAGMAERPGLVGQADGGTLFLDEIAELPLELQTHLLRVLDAGEYARLGEATPRRADFRLVGATNRAPSSLKHDVLARLTIRVALPPLSARREDVALLARHLLRAAAEKSPELCAGFVDGGAVRIDGALVDALVRHAYTTHVRELGALLWRAMASSSGDRVALTDELKDELASARAQMEARDEPPAAEPDAAQIRASLASSDGSVTKAARALGVSRFALYRLLKKHGIEMERED